MKKKRIPCLTHLQVLVLIILQDEVKSGDEIRQELEFYEGEPAFYQLMQRMENAGYIVGEYRRFSYRGKNYRERFYFVAESGKLALKQAVNFYEAVCKQARSRTRRSSTG